VITHKTGFKKIYNKDLLVEITSQNLEPLIDDLYSVASTNFWSEAHLQQYNVIDQTLCQTKLAAKQCCQKFWVGQIPWTLVLNTGN